ncbi:hypothetical protein DEU56DRAFT_892567 [Suillus clintonianus]|uniref:uncharacterized protein n=1 Tax=Suillus clintonianus TaxID=1904413 RepID=UPI001B875343|nr:uncharacterized protein DEU56DRAFT_892567 [Suillus clintonianus]KAG2125371.1 hypothetical protein DEU56DRAFT_892567 [Suillus clintonianus]
MSPPGDNGTSSTPPRANAVPNLDGKIKSTPNNRGTATVSEHISLLGVNVPQVSPWVQRDIEEAKTCKVDAMLQVLLERASCNKEKEQPDLLQKCLEAVLPVCNGDVAAADPKKGNDFHSKGIKDELNDYLRPGHEEKYYAPFIKVTNIALACLEEIKVDGMRPVVSAVDMICQQNDMPMFQSHQKEESLRKPDVVFLPSHSSLAAFPQYDGLIGGEHGVTNATAKPEKNLRWEDVLACIEFKRKPNKLNPRPSSYKVGDHLPTKPEYLRVDDPEPDNPPTPAPAAAPKKTRRKQPASDPPPRRSPRIAAFGNAAAPGPASASASKPQSSSKRKGGEQLGSAAKRFKPGNKFDYTPDYKKPHVTVQTGLYAAEMFAANLGVNHLLNFIVIDDVIWIWYYDRQGVIQCSGINFIQDLPRFMVLLYALQRFELDDWGRNTRFLPHTKTCQKITIQDADLGPVDLLLHTSHEERVTHYGLQGRATNVVPVTSTALTKKHGLTEMVAKIYWGEENRTSEPEILKKVKEIAEKEESVKGHIPELLYHHTFRNPTSAIRKALGVPESTAGSRVLHVLIFRKLNPITKLEGKELFEVWRQCILCHIALWKAGVYHRDVSPGNMMWYRDTLGKLMGVLNDYDLSSLADVVGPQGNERTGTVPFMALELLSPQGQRGEVKHLYRHDLESFMWVFAWVFLRYRGGVLLESESRPLDIWATSGAGTCGEKKLSFLNNVHDYEPSDNIDPNDVRSDMWDLIMECFLVLDKAALDRRVRLVQQGSRAKRGQQTNVDVEESHSDMDDLLFKFTTSKSWMKLSERSQ